MASLSRSRQPAVTGGHVAVTATVVGLLLAACGGRGSPPAGSPTPGPAASVTITEQRQGTAEPSDCLTPPEPYRAPLPEETVPGSVGVALTLDAMDLLQFAGSPAGFAWRQVTGSPESLEYLTTVPLRIESASAQVAVVTADSPGLYGLELTARYEDGTTTSHRLNVRVPPSPEWRLDIRGAVFGDVFGQLGATEFNLNPDSPECRDAVLRAAMRGPSRVGLNAVAFVPALFYSEVRPRPSLTTWKDLSLEDDVFYAALLKAAHAAGLAVIEIDQDAPAPDFTASQHAELEAAKADGAWWDAWFDVYHDRMVERAARAELYGVDVFVPYLLADFTFVSDIYPDYERRWEEILSDIRGVFSGTVGMSFGELSEPVSFSDEFDVVLLSLDSGQFTFSPLMEDTRNPGNEEVRAITREILDYNLQGADPGKPVWVIFQVVSIDGQGGVEDPDLREARAIDFQEQALYYEAILAALREDSRVTGVLTERWDWFDQFDRGGGSFEARFFDQTRESSPRSKPAEQVLELWFENKGTAGP